MKGLEIYLTAAGITDNGQKRALLLYRVGDNVRDIFETVNEVDVPGGNVGTYQAAGAALNTYFCPKTNKHFERHIFRSCAQDSTETIHKYVTRLCTLAETCQFHDKSEEIVDQVIEKCTSQAIITKLRKLFCRYGTTQELITDHGPQFVSKELKLLLSEFGTKHRLVTPYHPEANGEVERFNHCLKKCIQTAAANGRNWRIDLETFLLNYRNTQHATTKETPAKLMFGRNLRDKLPLGTATSKVSSSLAKIDNTNKLKGKAHADKVRRAKPTNIKSGDRVLITNTFKHRNKLSSRWQPQPLTVTQVKGNAIFMQRDGKTLMRSAGQVKLYYTSPSAIQPRPRLSEISTSDSSVDSHETALQLRPQDEATAEPDTTDSDQSTEEQHIMSDQWHSSDTTAPYNLDADDESSDN